MIIPTYRLKGQTDFEAAITLGDLEPNEVGLKIVDRVKNGIGNHEWKQSCIMNCMVEVKAGYSKSTRMTRTT